MYCICTQEGVYYEILTCPLISSGVENLIYILAIKSVCGFKENVAAILVIICAILKAKMLNIFVHSSF